MLFKFILPTLFFIVVVFSTSMPPVRAKGVFNTSQDQQVSSPIIFVIHVDVMPPFTKPATELLLDYQKESAKDAGVKRIEVFQQNGHLNHFSVVEEWESQKAYDSHISAEHTRKFRTDLQPMLGSPFDERDHHLIK
jgi:quinol monooxygenase YgiN